MIYGVRITYASAGFIAFLPRAQTEVCATRSRGGLSRLGGEDHDLGYHKDTVTATGLWDRIGACPTSAIIRANALG